LKKVLTIGLVAAALNATLPFVFAGSKGAVPSADTRPEYRIAASVRLADASVVVPAYTRGPRIIHVPQATERNERLNSRASVTHDPAYDGDDDITPPPRRQIAPPPPRRAETPAKPRSETRTVRHIDMSKPKAESPVPQPPSPRRAVLSAPRLPEITADTPPPGYTPPAAPPRDDGHGNSY
jgi:hypothetical protein